MDIVQPSNSIPLPAEIENAIMAGKNIVTLLEADTNRLSLLKGQLGVEITNLQANKVALEAENAEKTQAEEDDYFEQFPVVEPTPEVPAEPTPTPEAPAEIPSVQVVEPQP